MTERVYIRPRKAPRPTPCPTCGGEGGQWPPYRDLLAYDGPPWDLYQECSQCGGEGVVLMVSGEWELENHDPYRAFLFRFPEEEQELAEWVRVYREARHQAHLPPHEAARVADDAVYGPLPLIHGGSHDQNQKGLHP